MPNSEPLLDPNARILILTPDANSHRRDFDFVFKPEADLLARFYRTATCQVARVPVAPIDPRTLKVLGGQRAFESAAAKVLELLANGTAWTHVLMLCHGWATGLQLGFRSGRQRGNDGKNFDALCEALKALPLESLTLFACSAGCDPMSPASSPGTGDDSIADCIRDRSGVTVIAHVSVGHATRNPNLILFEAAATTLIGGIRVPMPGTALFKNAGRLLGVKKDPRTGKLLSDVPPRGHKRPAFASVPLCRTAVDLQALLSAQPAAAS